jgi:hypothetical protein
MPSNSKQLLAELAVEIAQSLKNVLAHGDLSQYALPDYFEHSYSGDFTVGCDALWDLNCGVAGYGIKSPYNELSYEAFRDLQMSAPNKYIRPPYFRVDAPDVIRKKILEDLEGDPSRFMTNTLSAYVAIDGFGGNDQLSVSRDPFVPPARCRPMLRLLAEHGYVENIGEHYIWTNKIAPAMQLAYFWSDDGQSLGDVEDARLENEARAAWEAMPVTIQESHFRNNGYDLLEITKVLMKFWKDGTWRDKPEEESDILSAHLNLARRLIKIAKAEKQQ